MDEQRCRRVVRPCAARGRNRCDHSHSKPECWPLEIRRVLDASSLCLLPPLPRVDERVQMNRHQFNVLTIAVPVCAALLLQVGCSTQSADAPVTTSSAVSPSTTSAPSITSVAPPAPPTSQAFTDCMTEHGIAPPPGSPSGPPPDGAGQQPSQAPEQGSPPPGVDQRTWEEALSACGSLGPQPPGA